MHIAICIDNNYVMPAGVLICSVCENNKNESIAFHIVTDDKFQEKNKKSLEDIVLKYNNKKIEFHIIDETLLKKINFDIPPKYHFSISTFYRLLFSYIFSKNIDKLLYLDSDIIVRNSLKELWEINIENHSVAAVTDMREGDIEYYNRLGYESCLGYFNAGVLLINLKYWRDYNLSESFIDCLANHKSKLRWLDQDILNFCLKNSKLKLDMKHNVQEGFLYKNKCFDYTKYKEELEKALESPIIIHYTSDKKPWYKNCIHPWKDEFLKYKALTEWNNMPLQKKKKKKTNIERIKDILRFFHIIPKVGSKFDYSIRPLQTF